jgi:hypothetical protein
MTGQTTRPWPTVDAPPAESWARSGLLWLTGHPGAPPRWPAADVVGLLEETCERIAGASTLTGTAVRPDPLSLMSGRAALLGLSRSGRRSAGGACRLLATLDGWVAVSLARPEDHEAVAAVIGADVGSDTWSALTRAATAMPSEQLEERALLLGLAAARLPLSRPGDATGDPERIRPVGSPSSSVSTGVGLVVDLSSMWAGPLGAKLLGEAGARIVKVESVNRPDGARQGNRAFFDGLHPHHQSVALDFDDRDDLGILHQLLHQADVVIEASRPRALLALGIDARSMIADRPGKIWLSITGHGREGAAADRVAFGDDAGVAAGMVAWDDAGQPVFCGDALADPITGLHGARAVLDSRVRGGGELIELAMVDAVRHTTRPLHQLVGVPQPVPHSPSGDRNPDDRWEVVIADRLVPVGRPAAPPPSPPSCPMGADTAAVVAELGLSR